VLRPTGEHEADGSPRMRVVTQRSVMEHDRRAHHIPAYGEEQAV
jgi:hypothetical protein